MGLSPHDYKIRDEKKSQLEQLELKELEVLQLLKKHKDECPIEYFTRPNPPQKALIDAFENEIYKVLVFTGGNRVGKAQPYGSILFTPKGEVRIENLEVGDFVIGSNGKPTKVIDIFEQGIIDTYTITFNDGVKTRCSLDHLWKVLTPYNRFCSLSGRGQINKNYRKYSVINTKTLFQHYQKPRARKNTYSIPLCKGVEFMQDEELPIHPYLLGALIGDGSLTHQSEITSADKEVLDLISEYLPLGHKLKERDGRYTYNITSGRNSNTNFVTNSIRDLGLNVKSEFKFIPDKYKYTSIHNRQALLNGLMDTDGYAGQHGHYEYYTVSSRLAQDVNWLVKSLGGISKISNKESHYTYKNEYLKGKLCYRISVQIPELNPFALSRKAKLWSQHKKERIIDSVEFYGKEQCRCISVDNSDGTYLTNDFIVTHNTTVGAILALCTMIGYFPWSEKKLIFPHKLPRKVRYIGQDWERHVAQVVVPALKKWYPHNRECYIKKNMVGVEAFWRDIQTGSTLEIMSNKQESELHEGWDGDLIVYDEPPKRSIRVSNARGLVDRGGRELFCMTLLKEGWVDREIIRVKDDATFTVHGDIYTNVGYGLTIEGIKQFEKTLTEDEKDARLLGIPSYLSGLVYGMFKHNIHIIERRDIPADWIIDVAIDIHPREKQAVLFIATSPDNVKYLIYEIWQHGTPEDIGILIINFLRERRVGTIQIDPLSKGDKNNINTIYDRFSDSLASYGYSLKTASKDKSAGILKVKEGLMSQNKVPSLFVFNDLKRTIFEFEGYLWDEDTQKPQDKDDHMMENLYRLMLENTQWYEEKLSFSDYESEYGRNAMTGY